MIAILAFFGYYITPLATSIKQGLDLQGGTHVVLEAVDTPEAKVDEDAVQRVVKIIEKRVNEIGLTEPLIQRQGERRIIVELPGISEPEKAIQMLCKTALLEFQDESGKTVMTGKDLKDAKAEIGQNKNSVVSLEFSSEGANLFGDLTTKNVGKRISILLDKTVLTSPVVNEPIPSGKAIITGSGSIEEAQNLAILLRSGSLPVKVQVLEMRTVGPTLGQDSKDKSPCFWDWCRGYYYLHAIVLQITRFCCYGSTTFICNDVVIWVKNAECYIDIAWNCRYYSINRYGSGCECVDF